MGTAGVKMAVENQQGRRGEQDGRNENRESCVHGPNMMRRPRHFQTASLRRLPSEHWLGPPDGFPAEIIMGAGPGMNFGLADPAFEFAGMLVPMLLSRCGIIHSATGTGEFF
jgi:hypothetical protein